MAEFIDTNQGGKKLHFEGYVLLGVCDYYD